MVQVDQQPAPQVLQMFAMDLDTDPKWRSWTVANTSIGEVYITQASTFPNSTNVEMVGNVDPIGWNNYNNISFDNSVSLLMSIIAVYYIIPHM
jgi:hypothetical protein